MQFGATWCEVYHAMEGVVAGVGQDAGRIAVVENDFDTDPAVARRFLASLERVAAQANG